MKRALLTSAVALIANVAFINESRSQFVCANCSTEISQIVLGIQNLLNEAKDLGLASVRNGTLDTTFNSIQGARNVGSALNAMQSLGIQNPLPTSFAQVENMVNGTSVPVTRDQWIQANADARKNIGQLVGQAWQGATNGLQNLNNARSRLASANDLKDVEDANANIALTSSEGSRNLIQTMNASIMSQEQPRVFEQRSQEQERREVCEEINVLRSNNDGVVSPMDCSTVPVDNIGALPMASATPTYQNAAFRPAGSTNSLNSMLANDWGQQAANNATALGVNPQALAATCQVESNCQDVSGAGTIQGPFQMTAATQASDMHAALAQNPALAGQQGPAAQSVAAAQELRTNAVQLQQAGVMNPTALQARGAYQFGAQYGVPLAQASDSTPMSSILTSYSNSTLASNGIAPSTTVGQWRAQTANRMGEGANAPILLPST